MKKSIGQLFLYFIIFNVINTQAQNNLFERSFQLGYTNYNLKFLKRDTTGFAVFTESIGSVAGPFGSANTVYSCNDTAFVTKKISLDSIIPLWGERFDILDWHLTDDGNYLVNYFGFGCDFGFADSSQLFKLSPTGNLVWTKKGLITDIFGGKTGLIKYLNGYLNYSLPSTNALASETVKLMFCYDNGNTRIMPEVSNNKYIQLYSNMASLYAFHIDNSNNENLLRIDTLGNTYQSFLLGSSTSIYTKRNFAYQQNKIIASYQSIIYLLNDTLALLQQQTLAHPIIQIEFDNTGNIWALSQNGDLNQFDANLNLINTINLINITTFINSVNWFNIDISKNRIYYGGMAAGHPYIKSMELSTYNHFQNANNILVTSTQFSNAFGTLTYQQPTAPVYGFSYQFNVSATIKNTGNTLVQKVFLNCSPPNGNYICNAPYLCKQFTNLNLLPGDSINLSIGTYHEYGIYIPINNVPNPYTRSNFCVWPSSPNDAWIHDNVPHYCQNVEISTLLGVNLNDLNEFNQNIILAPNPALDQINVTLPSNYTPNQISILNINGTVVASFNQSSNSTLTLDVSNLANGIYILQLNDGNQLAHKKFIKTN